MAESATVPNEVAGPEAPQAAAADPAERPAWLPEKFSSPEQMAEAYKSLEQKLGTPPTDAPAADAPAADAPDADPDAPEGAERTDEQVTEAYGPAVSKALTDAGLSPATVAAEFDADGSVSDATFEALEKAGYPRAMVEQYAKSVSAGNEATTALVEADVAEIKKIAGGDEVYSDMVQWASQNLSDADKAAFDKMVSTGDKASASMAVRALHAQYTAAEGTEPTLNLGGRASADVYASAQELSAAMTEARKTGDPAKIRAVEQKALRSNVFGQ